MGRVVLDDHEPLCWQPLAEVLRAEGYQIIVPALVAAVAADDYQQSFIASAVVAIGTEETEAIPHAQLRLRFVDELPRMSCTTRIPVRVAHERCGAGHERHPDLGGSLTSTIWAGACQLIVAGHHRTSLGRRSAGSVRYSNRHDGSGGGA